MQENFKVPQRNSDDGWVVVYPIAFPDRGTCRYISATVVLWYGEACMRSDGRFLEAEDGSRLWEFRR